MNPLREQDAFSMLVITQHVSRFTASIAEALAEVNAVFHETLFSGIILQ
jgi:hypothetical protein